MTPEKAPNISPKAIPPECKILQRLVKEPSCHLSVMIELESSEFSSRVEELMRQHHVPGVSIAIIEGGKISSAGYGCASLEAEKPCNADTLFDIASSSKSLTAAAVGLLVDDNEKYPEVQYKATMSSLLPDDFVMSGDGYTEGVTLEDILSHRSGMASYV